MIAEIHGKISSSGSNLSDRLEDQLTGDVFGTLRYLDANAALFPYLASGYFLSSSWKRQHTPDFGNAKLKEVRFWPWLDIVEPDLLLELDLDRQNKCVVFIEAKYYSGLSSYDSPDGPTIEEEYSLSQARLDQNGRSSLDESNNQLVRQMRVMKKMYPQRRKIQIFLTADRTYPSEILSEARQRADLEGLRDTELYWLSWHDLPVILRNFYEGGKLLSEREKIIIHDLLSLCERKGFGRFSKMEFNVGAVPSSCKVLFQSQLRQIRKPIPIQILNVPNARSSLILIPSRVVPVNMPVIYSEAQDGK